MSVTILIVGREQALRDRIRLALDRLGTAGITVDLVEAGDANHAMTLAEAEQPDLVVVEVGISPYGGFGLTRDLKSFPELSCPVVVVLERPQDAWLGRWSGADALVHRPVDPFALAQVARRLLEESGAIPAARTPAGSV